jgi:hypothetical protein
MTLGALSMSLRRSTIAACGLVVALAGIPARANISLSIFTTPPAGANLGTIGFAYAGNKFVGSTYDGHLYSTDLTGGSQALFATGLSLSGPFVEHFVAASSNYPQFPNRDLYVGEANGSIIHVKNDGSSFNTFVSGLNGGVRGIVFDTVGTFGNDMLVTTTSGYIYKIDGSGNPTVLAKVGEDTEGSTVVPKGAGFGAYDGQLIVGSEGSGNIRAIDSTGKVTVIGNIPSAEEVSFVPLNLGASHNPVEGFYGANYTQNVVFAGASQFMPYRGDLVVTGEFSHLITDMHWDGSKFVFSTIGQFPQQPEDGIFVTAAVINTPEPSTMIVALTAIPLTLGLYWRKRSGARL